MRLGELPMQVQFKVCTCWALLAKRIPSVLVINMFIVSTYLGAYTILAVMLLAVC